MKKLIKLILIVFVVLILTYLYLINFSIKEYRYNCNGTITNEGKSEELNLFMKLNKYALYTKLWGDSDANIWIEVPNKWVDSKTNIKKVGDDIFHIRDSINNDLLGSFSSLSNTLSLKTHFGFYDGKCELIK